MSWRYGQVGRSLTEKGKLMKAHTHHDHQEEGWCCSSEYCLSTCFSMTWETKSRCINVHTRFNGSYLLPNWCIRHADYLGDRINIGYLDMHKLLWSFPWSKKTQRWVEWDQIFIYFINFYGGEEPGDAAVVPWISLDPRSKGLSRNKRTLFTWEWTRVSGLPPPPPPPM